MQQHIINDRQHTRVVTESLSPNLATLDFIEDTSMTTKPGNVGEHALMREGLRQLLELEEDMHIVGEAVNGLDALQKIRRLRPQVVLIDIHMPLVDGIAVTRQVTNEFPSIAVIMLTMYRQSQPVLEAMRNGARGYLLKNATSQELVQAIRTVYEGGMLIEPGLTGAVVNEFRRLSDLHSPKPVSPSAANSLALPVLVHP